MERYATYVTEAGEYDDVAAGEALAGTLCSVFRADKNDFGVTLLANSNHSLIRRVIKGTEHFHSYKWRIMVPPTLYIEYKKQEAQTEYDDDLVSEVRRLGSSLLSEITEIEVTPRIVNDEHWRLGAQAYLAGRGTNNQGNVFATNRPRIVHDELYFRTVEEQYLYDAFVARHLPVMPLPVVLRTDGAKRPDGTNSRIEPDFCFLYRGRFVVVELDGGSHIETPTDAEKRLQFLREAGAIVRRRTTASCADEAKAKITATQILRSVDEEIDAR